MQKTIFKYLMKFILVQVFIVFSINSHAAEHDGQSLAIAKRGEITDVVVYGLKDKHPSQLTAYINGHLVGSLAPETYAQAQVCKGSFDLLIKRRLEAEFNSNQTFDAKLGETIYLKVSYVNTGYSIQQVSVDQATQELKNAKISPVINRFVPSCTTTPMRKVNLGVDSLFMPTNSATLSSMGIEQLQSFIADVKSQVNQIGGLKVIGYTDAMGAHVYNNALSLARAKTVAQYLEKHGLNMPMEVEGRGESEPVSKGCERFAKNRNSLIDCLQPDRRVVIELTGQN
jgi:outer membrane protein OmpA-like peptidoglycan-associated protein